MADFDGEIRLGVKLTPTDIKQTAARLRQEITKIFDGSAGQQTSKQFQRMEIQLDKLNNKSIKLQKSLEKMETTKIPTEQYASLTKTVEKLEGKLERLGTKSINLQKGPQNLKTQKALDDIEKEADKIQSQITFAEEKLQKLVDEGKAFTLGSDTQKYTDTANELNTVNNQITQTVSAMHSMQNAEENTDNSTKILEDRLKSFGNSASRYIVKGLDNIVHGLDRGISKVVQFSSKFIVSFAKMLPGVKTAIKLFDRMKSSLTGMGDSIAGHVPSLRKLVKMFLKYALGIRSVFLLWRKLRGYATEALKTMAKEIEEVNVDVSDLMNTFNQFKMSMGTLVQPLMHALAPAITYIINLLVSAANTLANFFAILTGQRYIYKAVKANDKYGESIGGVGSAAADANEKLAEYDNLLVIDQDKGGGGGGGGGAGGIADTFEKVIAESDFAKALRESIEAGDWYGVGVVLGDKLNSLVAVVDDWIVNKFEPVGKEFAHRLALILNGAIETIDFYNVGKTLADGINAIFRIADTFLVDFDFANLGKKLGEGINGVIDTIDAKQIGKTLVDTVNGAIDFALNLAQTIHWNDLGDRLSEGFNEYIRNFKAKELGQAIHEWIRGALIAATTFFEKTDFEELGKKIGEFIGNLDIGDLTDRVFKLAGKVISALASVIKGIASTPDGKEMLEIGAAIAAIFGAIRTFTIVWDAGLKTVIGTAVGDLVSEAITKNGANIVSTFKRTLSTVLNTSGAGGWTITLAQIGIVIGSAFIISDSIKKIQADIARELNGDEDFAQTIEEFGGLKNLPKAFGEAFSFLTERIGESRNGFEKFALIVEAWFGTPFASVIGDMTGINELFAKFGDIVLGIAGEFVPAWEEIGKKIKEIGGFIVEGLLSPFADDKGNFDHPIRNFFNHLIDAIKYVFGISSPAKNMYEYGEYILEGILEGFTNAFNEITDAVKACWKAIKKAWDESKTKKYFEDIVEKVEEPFKDIKDWFAERFEGAWDKLSEKWNESSVKKHFDNIVEKIKRAFDTSGGKSVAEAIGEKFTKAWENVKSNWSADKQGSHFANIANIIKNKFSGVNDIATWFKNKFTEAWTGIKEAFTSGKVSEYFDGVKKSILDKFTGIKDNIKEKFSDAWKSVTGIWDTEKKVGPHFNTVKNKINSNFNDATKNIKDKFSDAWSAVIKVWNASTVNNEKTGFGAVRKELNNQFNNATNNITNTFNTAWKNVKSVWNDSNINSWFGAVRKEINNQFGNASSYISSTFSYDTGYNIFNKFVSGALKPFENFADKIKAKIDEAIKKLNDAVNAVNNQNIKIDAPKINNPNTVSYLAQGAVVPSNKEFLSAMSSQTTNTNEGLSLDTMVEAFKMAMADENSSRNNQPIVLQLNGRTVAEVVWNESEKRYKQSGRFMPSYV